jgi:hypothetical protein
MLKEIEDGSNMHVRKFETKIQYIFQAYLKSESVKR